MPRKKKIVVAVPWLRSESGFHVPGYQSSKFKPHCGQFGQKNNDHFLQIFCNAMYSQQRQEFIGPEEDMQLPFLNLCSITFLPCFRTEDIQPSLLKADNSKAFILLSTVIWNGFRTVTHKFKNIKSMVPAQKRSRMVWQNNQVTLMKMGRDSFRQSGGKEKNWWWRGQMLRKPVTCISAKSFWNICGKRNILRPKTTQKIRFLREWDRQINVCKR